MDDELKALKSRIGIDSNDTSNDATLLTYLTSAQTKILRKAYPFDNTKTEIPTEYADLVIDIAEYLYNRRGSEGEISHNENGINRSYESAGIPDSMLKDIIPEVGI